MVDERVVVYDATSNLYDAVYAPREVILAIIVTSSSITVRLLGRTEQGTYAPLPNTVVHVYELSDSGTWNHVGDFTTDESGKVAINRSNSVEWYKVVFDGTDEYQAAVAYTWLLEARQQVQPAAQPCALWLWLLLLLALAAKREEEAAAT